MNAIEAPEVKSLRPFAIMWGGQAASLFGTRIVRFALVWWITDITGSATVLALASIAALLPQVLVAPFAGSYVDRWSRRKTMIVADSLTAATILALSFLFALNVVEIWHLVLIMLLGSAFGAFHFPAMQASTTLMVPRKHLARVGGMNQGLNGASNVVAPPIGAVLYALLPMQSILLVDVTTAAFAVFCLAIIKIPQPAREISLEDSSVLSDMKEGLIFLKGWSGGIVLVFLAMMVNLLSAPAFSLSPILVSKYFLGNEIDLAILQSFGAAGTVIGAVLLTIWGGGKRKIVTALAALTLEGIGTVLIGLVPADSFMMAVAFYAVVSFLNPIINGVLVAIFQATIPPDKQGRVFAIIVSGASAMMPIGLAIAGPVADITGVPFWFIVSGVGTTILSLAAFFVPSLMRIEDHAILREKGQSPSDQDDLATPELRTYASENSGTDESLAEQQTKDSAEDCSAPEEF
ncbi:MAG: MFS transporter [Candidatus Thorarchaeota archaeon]|nr:MFS transporter [Candidatus Thorarchaeota archaeon]